MPHSQKTDDGNALLKREDQWRGKSEIKEMGSTMGERQGNSQYTLEGNSMTIVVYQA